MNPNSITYFFFFLGVFSVFHVWKNKGGWIILLVASYTFYFIIAKPSVLLVLILMTLTIYSFGLAIENTESYRLKKTIFILGLLSLIGLLFYFKYWNFIISGFISQKDQVLSHGMIVIGLSFIIFQALSYLIDVYLEKIPAEKHLGYLALSLALFSKIVQGPIERGNQILPQLRQAYNFNYSNIISGLMLFLYGLLKKIIIADNLADLINPALVNTGKSVGFELLLTLYCYSFQIYFDFSGYTDMAIGVSRLFNIHLTQNFNCPYLATSVADFWRRWHISFSRWLMDYLFMPLQLYWREWKKWGTIMALGITFLICGLWHGASLNFVIWGAIHAGLMIISILTINYRKLFTFKLEKRHPSLLRWLRIFITFNMISLSWLFFRLDNVSESWGALMHLFSLTFSKPSFLTPFGMVIILFGFIWILLEKHLDIDKIAHFPLFIKPTFWRHFAFSFIYFSIIFFLFVMMYSFQSNVNQPFIYVQF